MLFLMFDVLPCYYGYNSFVPYIISSRHALCYVPDDHYNILYEDLASNHLVYLYRVCDLLVLYILMITLKEQDLDLCSDKLIYFPHRRLASVARCDVLPVVLCPV